jgi:outer membrane protein OmpA-like peptidoglycan-associated protein
MLLAALHVSSASAQTRLNSGDLVDSLQKLETTPGNVSAALLRQQAINRVKSNQAGEPVNREPLSEQLNRLPQFTVEITFNLDSAVIKPESYRTLGVMADALLHPYLLGYKFLVAGHTDSSGKRAYNLELSQKRADAIREVLVTTFRIDSRRIEAVGLGEEQLRDASNPKSSENRRVQLVTLSRIK